jgi:hypothetical protein
MFKQELNLDFEAATVGHSLVPVCAVTVVFSLKRRLSKADVIGFLPLAFFKERIYVETSNTFLSRRGRSVSRAR